MAIISVGQQADFEFRVGSLPDDELRVAGFSGFEGVSRCFEFELELVSENPGIIFEAAVGKSGVLTIGHPEVDRYVHGLVSSFEQREIGKRFTTYAATFIPRIARLDLNLRSRYWKWQTAEQIVTKVLKSAGLSSDQFRFDLKSPLPDRRFTVQYRESDLHFMSRILEEEGLYFFHEHTESDHVLVIIDDVSTTKPITGDPTVAFHATSGMVSEEEHITEFGMTQQVRPGAIFHRDFDFVSPKGPVETDKAVDKDADLEVYEHPGLYAIPEDFFEDETRGNRITALRLEEVRSTTLLGSGESICPRLVPGYRFTMKDHLRPDDRLPKFNVEYMLLHVIHTASQPQVREEEGAESGPSTYFNSFECVPSDVVYRPPRETPKPVVSGIQTAIVVGPPGEEIYTDEFGRVKVQFLWDREGSYNPESSCWIRVAQSWAGPKWGAMWIPRVDQEVIIGFDEGDPDRPYVVGATYNGAFMPPYHLPADKTKSTIKSESSKGGGGFNEWRFEDKKGAEEIYVHAEKDLNEEVGNDMSTSVTHDQSTTVGGDQTNHIKGNHIVTVDGGSGGGAGAETRGSAINVTGDYKLDASNTLEIQAPTHIKLTCGGSSMLIEPGKITISATGGAKVVLDANALIEGAGGGSGKFDAGATIKGATAKVEAPGLTEIKGGPVKLN